MTPADFPLTFALIRPNYARSLESALKAMDGYEAEGVLLKVELEGIKYAVSNAIDEAWNKTVRERYTYSGKWENLTADERKLEQSLGHPYAHTIGGYLKKAQAAIKADGPMRNDMIAIASELAPLGARVVALKDIIGKRAPKPTKTSIARDERDAKAMTCQCCNRRILAETGKIAHHGYTRPQGWGYQTASCEGALELPFENDRAALGKMIDNLKAYKARQEEWLEKVKAETTPLMFVWMDKSQQVNRWDKAIERRSTVTRETFDAVLAEIADKRVVYAGRTDSFDYLKGHTISRTEQDIDMVGRSIVYETGRYEGWVKTHEWADNAWVAIEGAAA